jgi:hypothetical protein
MTDRPTSMWESLHQLAEAGRRRLSGGRPVDRVGSRATGLGIATVACVVAGLLLSARTSTALELSGARVSRLENGLTLIVLEDHTLPKQHDRLGERRRQH